MPDMPYLNRELDEKFEYIKQSLGRIEVQTNKTNGRVNALEESKDNLEKEVVKIRTFLWLERVIIAAAWALILAIVSGIAGNIHL